MTRNKSYLLSAICYLMMLATASAAIFEHPASSSGGTGGVLTNNTVAAVIANFYTNSTPHWIEAEARLGTALAGRIQAAVTNSDNSLFFHYQNDLATVGALSNTISFKVPPGGWWKFSGLTTTATDGQQQLLYMATNGSVTYATSAGTATTADNITTGANLNTVNAAGITNLLSGKNEMPLGGARFAAGKVMKADYTYPSFTNLLTVTLISESWSWMNGGWHQQLEEKLREQLGNGGEFSLVVAPYTGSMPVPSWTTTTNGTWLNKEYYFEAQPPGAAGSYIAFTNLYCRYADVWYQPTASSTMDVYTNGVLALTTGASSVATNLLIDFGELRTHTLCLTNAGNGMRVTALNALTGEPGVNLRSISYSGYTAENFWTNVAYQSFVNHRQITNDCVLIRHGLNEYLSGGAAGIEGFETNLFRLATNIHSTFSAASLVLMSSPQVGTTTAGNVEEINTKVRRMVSTNSWMWFSDGLNNQWTSGDGTALGAWNANNTDTQHYNERGHAAYANYICRDVFGFTASALRRRTMWLTSMMGRMYAGGTLLAPTNQGIPNELYAWGGANTICFPPVITSVTPKQMTWEIPNTFTEGVSTFALTQYFLTTNVQPINIYREVACINMDDPRRTKKPVASGTTYQQLLSGTNVFRVRELFSIGTKLNGSYYVVVQGGVSSLTNSVWYMGAKLEAW